MQEYFRPIWGYHGLNDSEPWCLIRSFQISQFPLTPVRLSQDIYLPTQMVFLRRTIWEIEQEVPNYMSISFACLHFFTTAWWRDLTETSGYDSPHDSLSP